MRSVFDSPRRGDYWVSKVLQRVVLGKKHGVVVVQTDGVNRTTSIEHMELHVFKRWASRASYQGKVRDDS
jgi:hypothetical protein